MTKATTCRGSSPSCHNHISGGYAAMTESNSTKVCSKCQIEKDISEFYKTPKGDYHCWCRPCCAEYAKSRRKKHKTKGL